MWLSKKKFNELKNFNEELIKVAEDLKNRAFLISVERSNGLNHFLFVRKGNLYQIDTKSSIEDPMLEWNEKLIR